MLPFLKNKQEGAMSSDVESSEEYGFLDAVAEDIMDAFEKKDKKLLKQALGAFCDYIATEDEHQDQSLTKED